MASASESFDRLLADATAQEFSGWDFSWALDRWREDPPPWDYAAIVQAHLNGVDTLLDMGTGGGEFLSSLVPLPDQTYATEGYLPNVPVARNRLEPLGVHVVVSDDADELPFASEFFDLIINRHDAFAGSELFRALKPGGTFVTQQVGGRNCIELNEFLQEEVEHEFSEWTLNREVDLLRNAGLEILRSEESYTPSIFFDIGAVVRYLTIIEWQIADFSLPRYRQRLLAMHRHILDQGEFRAHSHRFLIIARRPA
jgi:SAM-dependent methyltransferase